MESLTVKEAIAVLPGSSIVIPQEKYDYLLEDLKSIMVVRLLNAKMETIRGKHEIGERIAKEFDEGGITEYKGVIEKLSIDLKTSESELYRCIEFYRKYPDYEEMLSKIPEGNNLSWNLIRSKYIPDLPTASIPYIIPTLELVDQWGLVSWWNKCVDKNFTLLIKSPVNAKGERPDISLMVTLAKSENVSGMQAIQDDIRLFFLKLKHWKEEDLQRDDYARIHRSIKYLLIKSKGDIVKAKSMIKAMADKYDGAGLDWDLGTVVKKWMELANTDPNLKYMKKRTI